MFRKGENWMAEFVGCCEKHSFLKEATSYNVVAIKEKGPGDIWLYLKDPSSNQFVGAYPAWYFNLHKSVA